MLFAIHETGKFCFMDLLFGLKEAFGSYPTHLLFHLVRLACG